MNLEQSTINTTKSLRKNIISWYPFKEGSSILEIGTQEAEITETLGQNNREVVSVSFSEEIKNEVKQKLQHKAKIAIIVQSPENIRPQGKFDYITLIGILEYAKKVFNKTPEELIGHLKQYLKPDGVFIIATDNKLGISNLCTETEENSKKLLSKNRIEKILNNQNLQYKKYYYPLPNYIVPNVIFTDKHLPDFETIGRNLTIYDDNVVVALNETEKFKTILEEDEEEFKNYANSFLIECSEEILQENNIEFVAFSNIRKPQYRIQTIIQGENVYKYALNNKAQNHINEIKNNIDILKQSNINTIDSYDENRIISKYQYEAETLDKIIIEKCKQNKLQEVIAIINEFKTEIQTKLSKTNSQTNVFDKYQINYEKQEIENLNFVGEGLWDLNFKNCFYIDNKFYFYDQEWKEKNIPVEFIIYRAIIYFTELAKYIDISKIFEELKITQEQIALFKKLDDILQEQTRDKDMWLLHVKAVQKADIKNRIKTLEHDKEKILKDCQELLIQKDGRIKVLEDGMEEAISTIKQKEQEIAGIVNSTSWKITKPLRKIKGTDK